MYVVQHNFYVDLTCTRECARCLPIDLAAIVETSILPYANVLSSGTENNTSLLVHVMPRDLRSVALTRTCVVHELPVRPILYQLAALH